MSKAEMSKADVEEEFNSSLADLKINSKPHISMLTMLAEDYIFHAPTIVKSVENHLARVRDDIKLPVLYLIDSIVKNVGKEYIVLFSQNLVNNFCMVFERGDEKTRSNLFKLRMTWTDIFKTNVLYELDMRVVQLDPAWPVTANPSPARIHVNPKFLKAQPPSVKEELLKQKKELLELQKKKLELELLQTKAILEAEEQKLVHKATSLVEDRVASQKEKKKKEEKKEESKDYRSRDPRMKSRQNNSDEKKLKKEKKDKKLKENIKSKLPLKIEQETRVPPLKDLEIENVPKGKEEKKESPRKKKDKKVKEPKPGKIEEEIKNSTGSCSSTHIEEEIKEPEKKKKKRNKVDKDELLEPIINSSKDVDLRLISQETENVGNQKMMDLFGDEDVDLRQCAPPIPPLIPPQPPIISKLENSWANIKKTDEPSEVSKPLKISKRFNIEREELDSEDRMSENCNLIIKQAEEQLNSGNISFADYNKMLKDVVVMNEERKLQEAVRIEEMEIQDISDDDRPIKRKHDGFYDEDRRFGRREPWRQRKIRSPNFNRMPFVPRPQREFDKNYRFERPFRQSFSRELPLADPTMLECIAKDTMRTIDIDRVPHQVRFYGEIAIIFLNWEDPREVYFEQGNGKVILDDREVINLVYNGPYIEINIDGIPTKIRFGAPTRELYIDGMFYCGSFGGPPIQVFIGGRLHTFQLSGPLPKVQIGTKRRTDIVAGKINLIIDAKQICPVYLDSKPQRFDINGFPFILRFVDALQTAIINGVAFSIEFGGKPIPITIQGEKHYIRFSGLPGGIKQGYLNLRNMEGSRLPSPPPPLLPPPPPIIHEERKPQTSLDILASLMPSTIAQPADQNYSVENQTGNINVSELLQRLVAVGIVPASNDKKETEHSDTIIKVDFAKPETLKTRQPGLVSRLYSGIQCSTCGVRFPPEQTVKYSKHLDWHFRQNRRDKDSLKKVHSRKWNYDTSDWVQYVEIEDEEDRPESWFEIVDKEEDEQEEEPSVPVEGEDNTCSICQDKFDQYFNGEKEEWQLRNALRVDNVLYHPMCHKEYLERSNKDEEYVPAPFPRVENEDETIEIEEEPIQEESAKSEPPPSEDDDILEVKVLEKTVEFYELSDEEIEKDEVDEESEDKPEEISDTEMEVDFSNIQIKKEKLDPSVSSAALGTTPKVISSIDGNTEILDSNPLVPPKQIKINITSTLGKQKESNNSPQQPQTVTEQDVINYPASVKPLIKERSLKEMDPVLKGTETSALCNIM